MHVKGKRWSLRSAIQSSQANVFTIDHLHYEPHHPALNDGPDLVEIVAAMHRARRHLDAVAASCRDAVEKARLLEDERRFAYGEAMIDFIYHMVRTAVFQRQNDPARPEASSPSPSGQPGSWSRSSISCRSRRRTPMPRMASKRPGWKACTRSSSSVTGPPSRNGEMVLFGSAGIGLRIAVGQAGSAARSSWRASFPLKTVGTSSNSLAWDRVR